MPKQGGQGKGKPLKKDRNFGKALIRRQENGQMVRNGLNNKGTNMVSILENSALDDFIVTAEMGGEQAEVVRVHKHDAFLLQPSVHAQLQSIRSVFSQ